MKRSIRIASLVAMLAWTVWIWTTGLGDAVAKQQACYSLYGQGSEQCASADEIVGFSFIVILVIWGLGMIVIEAFTLLARRIHEALAD